MTHRGSLFGDIVGVAEDIAGRAAARSERERAQARQDALLAVDQGQLKLGRNRLGFDIKDAGARREESGRRFDIDTQSDELKRLEQIRQFNAGLTAQQENFASQLGISTEELDLRTREFIFREAASNFDRNEDTRRRTSLQDAAARMNDPNLSPDERNEAAAQFAAEEGNASFLDRDDPVEVQQRLTILLEGVRGEASSAAIDAFRSMTFGVGPDGTGAIGPIGQAGVGIDWTDSYEANRIKLQDGIDAEVERLLATPEVLGAGREVNVGIIRSAVTAEFERQFNTIRNALLEDEQLDLQQRGGEDIRGAVNRAIEGAGFDPNARANTDQSPDLFASQLPAAEPGSPAEQKQLDSIIGGYMRSTFPERFIGA